jgi:ABC-type uncharacterized transport system fused permease/ATPase subunit
MRPFHEISLILDERQLLRRFWQAASVFWRVQTGRTAMLAMFLIAVVLLQLLVQVALNLWNRHFFDALERKDAATVWLQAQLFVPLAVGSILLAAASVWGRMTAQRSWREALTRHVIEKWMEKDRFRHLNHLVRGSENPEYGFRPMCGSLKRPDRSVLAFFLDRHRTHFLWRAVDDRRQHGCRLRPTVTIPGYLVFGVILYSGMVTSLMIIFGHHLTSVIERSNQAEAEFRAAADTFRQEPAAQNEHQVDRRETLQLKLQAVLLWWREFCWQLVRTTLVSHGNFLFAPVVAWMLCAPKYLSGAMSLGELTQAAAAFVVVQGAFNWLVDNYQRLADWRSSAQRVATLLLALDELEAKERNEKNATS